MQTLQAKQTIKYPPKKNKKSFGLLLAESYETKKSYFQLWANNHKHVEPYVPSLAQEDKSHFELWPDNRIKPSKLVQNYVKIKAETDQKKQRYTLNKHFEETYKILDTINNTIKNQEQNIKQLTIDKSSLQNKLKKQFSKKDLKIKSLSTIINKNKKMESTLKNYEQELIKISIEYLNNKVNELEEKIKLLNKNNNRQKKLLEEQTKMINRNLQELRKEHEINKLFRKKIKCLESMNEEYCKVIEQCDELMSKNLLTREQLFEDIKEEFTPEYNDEQN